MYSVPKTIRRYEVQERIARGGMGAVYRAWDPRLERIIAIKLLVHDDDDLRERFDREARSVARLRHPNIVTIFDVGDFDGQPFIAMEYIQGDTLAELIQKPGPTLSVSRKLELIEEMCSALAYAHQMGIVHRDVKPANAIVDASGILKVLDFGIARVADLSGMTQTGAMMGSFNYMSPEHLSGVVDQRSDIFGVGAVLYELLCHQQAFPGRTDTGLLDNILHSRFKPLQTVHPGLDPEIVRIVHRALEADPHKRYQDLGTMMKEIQRIRLHLSTTHVIASPPPQPSRPTPPPVNRENLVRRRAAQIEQHLAAAKEAFAAGDFEAALASCEQVLMLDSDDQRALELIEKTRLASGQRQAEERLDEAELELRRGALTAALAKIEEALVLDSASVRAVDLRRTAEEALQERLRAKQRADALRHILDEGHERFDRGKFREALAAAEEALTIDPGSEAAVALKADAVAAIEAEARDALDRAARETVREARRLFNSDNHEGAIALLAAFEPPHELVSRTLNQFRAEALRIAEQRRVAAELLARQARITEEINGIRADIQSQELGRARDRIHALEESEGEVAEVASLVEEIDAIEAELKRLAAIEQKVAEHVAKAARLFVKDDFEAALAEIQAALALDPRHANAASLRSKIQDGLRAAAERRDAEQRRALEKRQLLESALDAARQATSTEIAVAAFQRALEIDPDCSEARQELDKREAQLAHEQADRRRLKDVERERRAHIQGLVRAAHDALTREDLVEARALIRQVLDLEPGNAEALAFWGDIEPVSADQITSSHGSTTTIVIQTEVRNAPNEAGRTRTIPIVRHSGVSRPIYVIVLASVVAIVAVGYVVKGRRPGELTGADSRVASVVTTEDADRKTRTKSEPPNEAASAAPSSSNSTASGDPNEEKLATLRKRASEQFAAGQASAALATVAEGRKLRVDDPELKRILDLAVSQALRNAETQRQTATAAGSSARSSANYQVGLRNEQEAARSVRSGRSEDAMRSASLAAELYDRATRERQGLTGDRPTNGATSVPAPPASPRDTSSTSSQADATPITGGHASQSGGVPANQPAPPPAAVLTKPEASPATTTSIIPPTPPSVRPPQEEPRIKSVIDAYVQAYSDRNVDAVRQVYPGVNERALRDAFGGIKSQQVQIQEERITVNGTSATVSCMWTSAIEPLKGARLQTSRGTIFQLQKMADKWVIVDRR